MASLSYLSLASNFSGSSLELPCEASPLTVARKFKTSASSDLCFLFTPPNYHRPGFLLSLRGIVLHSHLFLLSIGLGLCGGGCILDFVEGKLQSNETYYSDILQCICPVHYCVKSTLVSISSFRCSTKCRLFSLLRYVARSRKGAGIF